MCPPFEIMAITVPSHPHSKILEVRTAPVFEESSLTLHYNSASCGKKHTKTHRPKALWMTYTADLRDVTCHMGSHSVTCHFKNFAALPCKLVRKKIALMKCRIS